MAKAGVRMKIPKGMTEEEVVNQMKTVINRMASRYTFYGYTADDIKQESFIICMDAMDRYDETRSLENFLAVNLSNRLKNFVRDNHYTTSDDAGRINVIQPAQLDNENSLCCDEEMYDYNDIDYGDMVSIINRELSASMRMDYLKMINNVYIAKPRREEIKSTIVSILEDYGYEGDSL